MYFVYLTKNKINGKKYIGKHSGVLSDSYLGSGAILKNAIKKYGRDGFERIILATANDKEALDLLEKYYIKKYDAIKSNEFYNITEGGTGGNTLQYLPPNKLVERSEKIKTYFSQLTEEERLALSKVRSESAKKFRKDAVLEKKRIDTFRKTFSKKSEEQVRKQYESRSGSNAYQARRVITPNGEFGCASDAAKSHKVHTQTVLNRCKNTNFCGWEFVND